MPSVKKPERLRTRTFVRAWREHRRLTQEQMAGRLDMSRENYSKIENGKVPYNQDFLEMAALAMQCNASDLLERNPVIQTHVDELRRLMMSASENEQKQIIAIARTLLENKG